MSNNIKIGQIGENLACRYLLNNGYKIVERNYRQPWGEIDIICKAKDRTLVFVEVKTLKAVPRLSSGQANNVSQECFTPLEISRPEVAGATPSAGRSLTGFTPEDNLSASKLEKVKRTAYLYANNNSKLIDEDRGWRIDLMAIEIKHLNPETIGEKELLNCSQIRCYENL